MEMTIVHHESQLKQKKKMDKEGDGARRARQARHQYHQDRKHHNLGE
jgi:hypothetical protein